MNERERYRYQVGGSLPPKSATYVVRQADHDLLKALLDREYCYILNARQMGKSSLRARITQQLKAQGVASAEVELNGIGTQQITAQQWYGGIIWELTSGFSLSINRRQWLQAHEHLSPVQRLDSFIASVLLVEVTQPVVIFFDEIDSTLGLDFSADDFFALIRHCYEKRATDERYQRLSIVLIGAASPSDLIQNKRLSTPFDIGRAISLEGFQPHEVSSLAKGFESEVRSPDQLLENVLHWSGGQPFLTQKICRLVQQKLDQDRILSEAQLISLRPPEEMSEIVRKIIYTQIINQWKSQDEPEHLRSIQDNILQTAQTSRRLQNLYKKILRKKEISIKDQGGKDQRDHLALLLSGLVMKRSGKWVIKNPIYRHIFTPDWFQQSLQRLSVASPISTDSNRPLLPAPFFAYPGVTSRCLWATVAIASLLTTGATGMFRATGLLQPTELQAFDLLMKLRPPEGSDDRLLIIEVTEADVQAQSLTERGAASLSDQTLESLLKKLMAAQPRTVGLDIYREQAPIAKDGQVASWTQSSPHLFAICKYGDSGVPPPPGIALENHGFNNVIEDADGKIRRYPLAVSEPLPCRNAYALSWLLAADYLAAEGISVNVSPDGHLRLGEQAFKPLSHRAGGYQQIDSRGHQLMINYRATRQIAEMISLQDFMATPTHEQLVRDRIVLIGTSAPSFNDHRWQTPLHRSNQIETLLNGAEVQAHLVSQLLSATLDQRPLIWSWHPIVDGTWVFAYSLIGSSLIVGISTRRHGFIVMISILGILIIPCWYLLILGGWMPLVPSVISIAISSIIARRALVAITPT